MGSRASCSITGWYGLVPGSSAGKFLEFAVVKKLSTSHQCMPATERANCILSCRNKRRAHSRNQYNCLFPFTCHSLEDYTDTLSSFSPLHPVKTLIKSIIESSNHRMAWFGRDPEYNLVPSPAAVSRDATHCIRLHRAPSNLSLNTASYGASTSEHNLLQYLAILMVKNFF